MLTAFVTFEILKASLVINLADINMLVIANHILERGKRPRFH